MSDSVRPSGVNSPPKYCRQKRKGKPDRAYVRIGGKKVSLGQYGTAESKAKYVELIADRSNAPPESSGDPSVSELILSYLNHAKIYYRKPDGSHSREYGMSRDVCKIVRQEYGTILARDFGPKKLKAVRQCLIDARLSRSHINKQVGRIVRMFKWAVAEEMVPTTVHQALTAVAGLKRGRTEAKESKPVLPVDMAVVDATLAELPEVVSDMVMVQLLTGCRPGEMVIMRPMDLDRSGPVWFYVPERHKTEHHGHRRTIAIGPKAQEILLRYLARGADACCFQPRDSEAKRLAAQEAVRITPLSCGNHRGTNRQKDPKRKPGDRYSVISYGRAIKRAAQRANVEHWTPHQLRHTKATDVRKDFGLDAAQAVLGHRGAKVTEVYAELDQEKAVQVALKIG